jgi:hypothetical protein
MNNFMDNICMLLNAASGDSSTQNTSMPSSIDCFQSKVVHSNHLVKGPPNITPGSTVIYSINLHPSSFIDSPGNINVTPNVKTSASIAKAKKKPQAKKSNTTKCKTVVKKLSATKPESQNDHPRTKKNASIPARTLSQPSIKEALADDDNSVGKFD